MEEAAEGGLNWQLYQQVKQLYRLVNLSKIQRVNTMELAISEKKTI